MNPPTFTRGMSSPTGEEPQRDRGGPSATKSGNGLSPTFASQRMTSCELPKTDPVGHALQLTVPQPTTIIMIKGMKVLGERVQGDVRVKGAIRVVGYT